jgi:microcystin-dependent protein
VSDQCYGEIRIFAGNYAPEGWALCDGSVLPITGNEALYSLLGTAYGGDGVKTFGLPDLRGRIPIGQGKSPAGTTYPLGQKVGTETVVLDQTQVPAHTHTLMASSTAAGSGAPSGNYLATSVNSSGGTNADAHYLSATAPVAKTYLLNANSIVLAGGSAPHQNIMPSLCVNFIIALQGVYPEFQ